MIQTLDMRVIRYLNLFEKITRVRTNNCFFYNNFIIFAVPFFSVSKAIGEEGRNVKKLVPIVGKKIKIVCLPESIKDARKFISEVVSPLSFNSFGISGEEIIISANRQNKASLIGRNKVRLMELQKIVKEVFGKNLKIV